MSAGLLKLSLLNLLKGNDFYFVKGDILIKIAEISTIISLTAIKDNGNLSSLFLS